VASPIPKPVALKILEGNPGKRRLPKQPKYAPLAEEAPDWLAREAKAEWRRLAKEFARVDLAKRPDRGAMIALCSEWAKYVQATRAMSEKTGSQRIGGKPAHQVARESLASLLQLWARFGMTPADRARLDMPEVEGEEAPGLHLLD
jgi:P27 family predicted phage terminase small subunit